ncbi:MAG TPA: hypothetical protein VNN17_12145 [Terriglobia bacterium]|nr:hypothetical protein [Terriglobia bacterium]
MRSLFFRKQPMAYCYSLLLLLAAASPALAQDAPASTYRFSGAVGLGYRFLDLNGNQGKYNQVLNLQEGFRVFDTQLDFLAEEPGAGWLDRFTITGQNLGGDPYPAIAAQFRKHGLYELRLGYRATQYFLDLPQTSLSPNRAWHDRRRFSDLELRYTPARDLRLRFFYNRTRRDGSDLAQSPFFYLPLGPEVWSAFGRANRLPWEIPLREEADLFGLAMDYRLKNTNLHIAQSLRSYNNPADLRGLSSAPLELLGPLSPSQNLVVEHWTGTTTQEIPTTSIHFDSQVLSRLQLRGGYVYSSSSGPGDLDATIVSPLGGTLAPVRLNITGRGASDLNSHTAEFGFSWNVLSRLDLISDYRYQSFAQRSERTLLATRADLPAPVSLSAERLQWDYGLHTLETQLAFVPSGELRLQAGLRFFKQDATRKVNGAVAGGTGRTWTYTPVVRVSWKPLARLSVRGSFEHTTVVDPYTRLVPENSLGSSIQVQYAFSDSWRLDNVWSFRNRETESLAYKIHSRRNSTTLSYRPESLVGFYGGFTYDSFWSENSVRYLTGAPPLSGLLSTDQTIDRTLFWGLKVNPARSLLLDLSGQFIRATGLGAFTGEPSDFGPLTWAAWDSQIAYDFPRLGRMAFGWQRSYYLEDLRRSTDYGANTFTLRIDRRF